jgi:hypothetical protein
VDLDLAADLAAINNKIKAERMRLIVCIVITAEAQGTGL